MICIIGGTGLYSMPELRAPRVEEIATPFGAPSAPLIRGTLHGREVAFLARHGVSQQLLPSEINFRANIWALKSIGVTTMIGVSAVEACARKYARASWRCLRSIWISPGRRIGSFFGAGLVAHVSTAHPTAPPPPSSPPQHAPPGCGCTRRRPTPAWRVRASARAPRVCFCAVPVPT
jgi:5'-methylthioadenosine phosphorylase